MPYSMKKQPGGAYNVRSPYGVKGRNMTKENAMRQTRLLRGVGHGWKPSGGKNAMARRMGY